MISETDIEKAVDWLRNNAEPAAKARAERLALEEGRKSLKAILMKEHVTLALGAQEREAYADVRYKTHLEGLRQAVYEDERNRMLRGAAITKIDAWRTMESSRRGVDRVA